MRGGAKAASGPGTGGAWVRCGGGKPPPGMTGGVGVGVGVGDGVRVGSGRCASGGAAAAGGIWAAAGAGAGAGPGAAGLRGANQLLAGSSASADAGAGAGAGAPAGSGAASMRVGCGPRRCASGGGEACSGFASGPVCSPAPAEPEPGPIALRTTTGGIGREPGMLIRIRVVRVVSVLGPSESGVDGFEVTAFSSGAVAAASVDGYWPVPYGGVPEG